MEGFNFSVVEKPVGEKKENAFSEKEIKSLSSEEAPERLLTIYKRTLGKEAGVALTESKIDLEDFAKIEVTISLISSMDSATNPEQFIEKIEVSGPIAGLDFAYEHALKEHLSKLDPNKFYNIYNLENTLHVIDKENGEFKEEGAELKYSHHKNLVSNGKIIE